jgi:hypothetical protein
MHHFAQAVGIFAAVLSPCPLRARNAPFKSEAHGVSVQSLYGVGVPQPGVEPGTY